MPRPATVRRIAGKALALTLSSLAGQACAETSEPPPSAGPKAVQATVWALEQAIYAGRGRGTLQPYIQNASPDFLAWPPLFRAPIDLDDFKASAPQAAKSQEKLSLDFERMTLSGDVALIYYRTHMTVTPKGEPTDKRYEVAHTWIWRAGRWVILGGMARATAGE